MRFARQTKLAHSHQQSESDHLQQRDRPYKPFPSEPETYDPDTQRPARICQAARRSADMSSDAQAEEVEQADAESDNDTTPQHRRSIQHLLQSAVKVKEWLSGFWQRGTEDGK